MKKLILSSALVAMAAMCANATSYQVFDITNAGTWAAQGTGFAQTMKFGDKSFTITTDKGSSTTDLRNPGTEQYSWRVYKGSSFTLSGDITMKKMVIGYDPDEVSGKTYFAELELSNGWTGTLEEAVYTLSNAGATEFTGKAAAMQVRIKSIVVSDDETISDTPLKPEFAETPVTPDPDPDPVTPTDGYTVFDINNPSTWTPAGTGFTTTVNVNGIEFTITTDKADSQTALISPVDNNYAWRVYKDSKFTISTTMLMKTVTITYDDYNDNYYVGELTLGTGWTGALNGVTFTATSEGLSEFVAQAPIQVRIKKIVVSGEGGEIVINNNMIYENSFSSNFDGWTELNSVNADENWWSINNSIGCLQCSSYYTDTKENAKADCILTRSFDLTDWENCELAFEQAYGFVYPTEQTTDCLVLIREEGDEWEQLLLANFGARKGTTNWTEFALNTFDISSYDGSKIELGFRYINEDAHAMVWELKNLKLTGTNTSGVEGVVAEDAAPVYYNLQGVRVANPERGLYIVVKGNKATKILL